MNHTTRFPRMMHDYPPKYFVPVEHGGLKKDVTQKENKLEVVGKPHLSGIHRNRIAGESPRHAGTTPRIFPAHAESGRRSLSWGCAT